jgi:hypothetical protein
MSCLWLTVLPGAGAAPLGEEVCKTYDAQQKILEIQGVKEDLARGPVWAKANLTPSRLEVIKHYIYLKEQVTFRCPSLTVLSAPDLAEPEAKQPLAGQAKTTGKSGKKTKQRRKKSAEQAVPAPAQKGTAAQ